MRGQVALMVSIWSRGQLVTLQILTNSSFSNREGDSRLSRPIDLLLLNWCREFCCLRSFFSFFIKFACFAKSLAASQPG